MIKDLRLMNISLLCKWWWMLENEEGMCLIPTKQPDSPV
jgi:hypothetical protein